MYNFRDLLNKFLNKYLMSEENNKISARKVMEKTITGDRKISGKRISPIEYFRVQTQNPSIGFLTTLFVIVIIILAIPIFPRVAKAVEVNEQKKVAFEEKLMPRSLAIPVNMLPYLRFQHLALKNGKYATWHQPVFRSGSCDRENLTAMPDGIYKQAIQTGCFQLNELQGQYAENCNIDNCKVDPNVITRINYIMSQIEEPYWGKGFVEEINPCSGSLQMDADEPCTFIDVDETYLELVT